VHKYFFILVLLLRETGLKSRSLSDPVWQLDKFNFYIASVSEFF